MPKTKSRSPPSGVARAAVLAAGLVEIGVTTFSITGSFTLVVMGGATGFDTGIGAATGGCRLTALFDAALTAGAATAFAALVAAGFLTGALCVTGAAFTAFFTAAFFATGAFAATFFAAGFFATGIFFTAVFFAGGAFAFGFAAALLALAGRAVKVVSLR